MSSLDDSAVADLAQLGAETPFSSLGEEMRIDGNGENSGTHGVPQTDVSQGSGTFTSIDQLQSGSAPQGEGESWTTHPEVSGQTPLTTAPAAVSAHAATVAPTLVNWTNLIAEAQHRMRHASDQEECSRMIQVLSDLETAAHRQASMINAATQPATHVNTVVSSQATAVDSLLPRAINYPFTLDGNLVGYQMSGELWSDIPSKYRAIRHLFDIGCREYMASGLARDRATAESMANIKCDAKVHELLTGPMLRLYQDHRDGRRVSDIVTKQPLPVDVDFKVLFKALYNHVMFSQGNITLRDDAVTTFTTQQQLFVPLPGESVVQWANRLHSMAVVHQTQRHERPQWIRHCTPQELESIRRKVHYEACHATIQWMCLVSLWEGYESWQGGKFKAHLNGIRFGTAGNAPPEESDLTWHHVITSVERYQHSQGPVWLHAFRDWATKYTQVHVPPSADIAMIYIPPGAQRGRGGRGGNGGNGRGGRGDSSRGGHGGKNRRPPKDISQESNPHKNTKCRCCKGWGHIKAKCPTYLKMQEDAAAKPASSDK